MVEAILDDSKSIISCCAILDGEYGYSDVAVGVPIVLGAKGVEKIIELELDEETKEKFDISVRSIQDGINILKENNFFES
jgi:malate dehydrogenase